MPQAFSAGRNMLAFGAGTYGGEQAFAIGLSHMARDGRAVIKAGVTYNSRSDAGDVVLSGDLVLIEGATRHALASGDCLELGPPMDCVFRNDSSSPCVYVVAVLRNI